MKIKPYDCSSRIKIVLLSGKIESNKAGAKKFGLSNRVNEQSLTNKHNIQGGK